MDWYYTRDGTVFGPMTFDQLAEAADSGMLGKDDLVWRADMQAWTPAGLVSELRGPQRMPLPRLWQYKAAPRNASSNRESAPIKGWLLIFCIGLAFIGSALSLAAIF
jgi:GYF domain 2